MKLEHFYVFNAFFILVYREAKSRLIEGKSSRTEIESLESDLKNYRNISDTLSTVFSLGALKLRIRTSSSASQRQNASLSDGSQKDSNKDNTKGETIDDSSGDARLSWGGAIALIITLALSLISLLITLSDPLKGGAF